MPDTRPAVLILFNDTRDNNIVNVTLLLPDRERIMRITICVQRVRISFIYRIYACYTVNSCKKKKKKRLQRPRNVFKRVIYHRVYVVYVLDTQTVINDMYASTCKWLRSIQFLFGLVTIVNILN